MDERPNACRAQRQRSPSHYQRTGMKAVAFVSRARAGLMIAAIGCGYGLREWQGKTWQRTKLQDFDSIESFSEVDNAKARLRSLCYEFISDLLDRQVFPPFNASCPDPDRLAAATNQLNYAITAFKGTEQELWVTRELLSALRLGHADGPWLDLYLNLLYCHPTDPIVSHLTAQAVAAAKSTGRQSELRKALSHLEDIPSNLSQKQQIAAILAQDLALRSPLGKPALPQTVAPCQ
jgi:hypothetical protein